MTNQLLNCTKPNKNNIVNTNPNIDRPNQCGLKRIHTLRRKRNITKTYLTFTRIKHKAQKTTKHHNINTNKLNLPKKKQQVNTKTYSRKPTQKTTQINHNKATRIYPKTPNTKSINTHDKQPNNSKLNIDTTYINPINKGKVTNIIHTKQIKNKTKRHNLKQARPTGLATTLDKTKPNNKKIITKPNPNQLTNQITIANKHRGKKPPYPLLEKSTNKRNKTLLTKQNKIAITYLHTQHQNTNPYYIFKKTITPYTHQPRDHIKMTNQLLNCTEPNKNNIESTNPNKYRPNLAHKQSRNKHYMKLRKKLRLKTY